MRIALLAAICLTSPAFAQDQLAPNSAAAAPSAKAGDDDRKVCRKVKTTGSRLGGVTECRTKRQWAEMSRATQDDMRNMPANTGY